MLDIRLELALSRRRAPGEDHERQGKRNRAPHRTGVGGQGHALAVRGADRAVITTSATTAGIHHHPPSDANRKRIATSASPPKTRICGVGLASVTATVIPTNVTSQSATRGPTLKPLPIRGIASPTTRRLVGTNHRPTARPDTALLRVPGTSLPAEQERAAGVQFAAATGRRASAPSAIGARTSVDPMTMSSNTRRDRIETPPDRFRPPRSK